MAFRGCVGGVLLDRLSTYFPAASVVGGDSIPVKKPNPVSYGPVRYGHLTVG